MKTTNLFAILLVALAASIFSECAWSDTFGSGPNTIDIPFVNVGNPGNAPDTTGDPVPPYPTGSVADAYRIGQFEISEQMIDKANILGGLAITKNTRGPDKPATSVGWFSAARFVNWLNTSSGSPPAYKFDTQPGEVGYNSITSIQLWAPADAGYNPNNLYRNSLARYFLPSVNEWYKAAYYDPSTGNYFDFATGSDSPPVPVASGTASGTAVYLQPFRQGPADITLAGGLSPYGTMGQGGNVAEWEETDFDLVNDLVDGFNSSARGAHGGSWSDPSDNLQALARAYIQFPGNPVYSYLGFRVASTAIPEPSTLLLGALSAMGLLLRRTSSR